MINSAMHRLKKKVFLPVGPCRAEQRRKTDQIEYDRDGADRVEGDVLHGHGEPPFCVLRVVFCVLRERVSFRSKTKD